MLSREIAEKVLGRCLITGGDFAEIFEEDTLNNSINILNGKVENSVGGRTYGIGIRIFKGLKRSLPSLLMTSGLLSITQHPRFQDGSGPSQGTAQNFGLPRQARVRIW